jgi:hypothetical protein
MLLLADATGNSPNVGTNVPVNWTYEYAYPTDCMKARFIPWNIQQQASGTPPGNIAIPTTVPLMTGLGQSPGYGLPIRTAKFLVASDPNYPAPPNNDPTFETAGVSPIGRTVVLTNVQNAVLVYTFLAIYPSLWDPLFRAALVAYLASEVALPLTKDRKMGLAIRGQQLAIVKQKLIEARLSSANEGTPSANLRVDWMATRRTGGYDGNFGGAGCGDGPGVWGYGYDSLSVSDGNVF